MFTEADVIISPHGAGLTNIISCDNATVIEIHPQNYVQSHYYMLSKGCGHFYSGFTSGNLKEKENYKIDVQEFDLFSNNLDMDSKKNF